MADRTVVAPGLEAARSQAARPEATRPEAAPPEAARLARAGWEAVRPRTLVDHAVDAILAAAARGLILPGDRLAEPDLAAKLGMSRVPVREALRILESQGVVTSTPYRGIRLMEVSSERLRHVIDVRIALETLACRRAIEQGRNGPAELALLGQAVSELELMRQRGDTYGFATADTAFHRLICGLAGNRVLATLWESIARQLTVIIGLSTMAKAMDAIVAEHHRLVEVFAGGDIAAMEHEIDQHIRVQGLDVDYATLLAARRAALDAAPARSA
jgi:DNA-binding GntR family transcriptional regulator